MTVFACVVLTNNIINFVLSGLAIKFSTNVLLKKKLLAKIIKLSPIITIFFVYVLIFGIVSLLHNLYLLIFWRPDENIYEARIMYLHGLLAGKFVSLNPVIGAFLCIDRCLTIIFPTKYDSRIKRFLAILCAAVLIFVLAFTTWITLFINPYPSSPKTSCLFYSCFLTSTVVYQVQTQKIITSAINITGCCILIILLRIYLKASSNAVNKRITKAVIFILLITTTCDGAPSLISNAFQAIVGQTLTSYIGPYTTTSNTVSVAICVKMYSRTLTKALSTPSSNIAQMSSHNKKMTTIR